MNGPSIVALLLACGAALIGFASGLAYFHALRRTVDLFTAGRGWVGPVGLTLARISGAIIVLIVLALHGAIPLLAGFSGFLLARKIATRPRQRA